MEAFDGRVGHIEGIESPWSNAGGVVKTVDDVEQMARTGVGWIEDGSHTLEPRPGNGWNPETQMRDKKDYDHDPITGESHNSLGMPGQGLDKLVEEIPEKRRIANAHNKPLIVNVAPVTDKPGEESYELISRTYAAGADGVILNAGCPNIFDAEGKPHKVLSRDPKVFGETLQFLADAGLQKPIWTRISPQETLEEMVEVITVIRESGIVSAVLNPNTWMVDMPIKSNGQPLLEVNVPRVGKSGPAMAEEAWRETSFATLSLSRYNIDVVSSSSVMNAKELKRRLIIGAKACAGTTFFYEPQNGWKEDVDKVLSELAA